jgi:hypothetical protein
MKFIDSRPFSDPEVAAKKLMEIASGIEPVQDGRIFIELINWPFLHDLKGSPAEYKAGLDLAIARLALASRERDLCEAHTVRRGSVCMIDASDATTAYRSARTIRTDLGKMAWRTACKLG